MHASLIGSAEMLPERDCWALLVSRQVARLAVTVDALPAVVPVNYVAFRKALLFYGPAHLRESLDHAVVALQVDDMDDDTVTVRSVTAVGVSVEVSYPIVVQAAEQAGLRPWRDDGRSPLMAVEVELLSGRRL